MKWSSTAALTCALYLTIFILKGCAATSDTTEMPESTALTLSSQVSITDEELSRYPKNIHALVQYWLRPLTNARKEFPQTNREDYIETARIIGEGIKKFCSISGWQIGEAPGQVPSTKNAFGRYICVDKNGDPAFIFLIKGTRQLDLSIDYSTAEEIKANAEAEREYRQMLESNGPIGTLSYGLSSDGIRFMQFYRLGEPRTRRLYYYGQGSGKDKKYVSWDEIAQLRFNQNTKRVEIHHRNKTVHDISIYDLYLRTDASKYERLYRQDTIRFVARIGEDRWAWSDVQVQEIQSIVFYGPSRWEHLKNQRLTTKDPSVP